MAVQQDRQAQNLPVGWIADGSGQFGHGLPHTPYPLSAASCLNSLPISLQTSRESLRRPITFSLSNHTHTTPHKMAKGLRASRTKKNNQALSKRVFGPVEAARNERLSAKLLALAQQPKAPREEMEIEKGRQPRDEIFQTFAVADQPPTDTAEKESGATAEGTPSFSIPIPKSVAFNDHNHNHQLLTPPSTPPSSNNTPANSVLDRAGQQAMAREQLFFHLLGASSDILGFDEEGDLRLAFDSSTTSSSET